MSTLLSLLSPTIKSSHSDAYDEIVLSVVHNELSQLVDFCGARKKLCSLDITELSHAVKGLFLIAYQSCRYYNWTIPSLYFQLAHPILFPVSKPINILQKSSSMYSSSSTIRVGFFSSFWFRHSVGRLLGNIILNLNQTIFEIYCINPTRVIYLYYFSFISEE